MEIQRAPQQLNSVLSYTQTSIVLQDRRYSESLWLDKQHVHAPWTVDDVNSLVLEDFTSMLEHRPEIILIGHSTQQQLTPQLIQSLAQRKIGIETMSIGAACRTFNILLSEYRDVALGLIFIA